MRAFVRRHRRLFRDLRRLPMAFLGRRLNGQRWERGTVNANPVRPTCRAVLDLGDVVLTVRPGIEAWFDWWGERLVNIEATVDGELVLVLSFWRNPGVVAYRIDGLPRLEARLTELHDWIRGNPVELMQLMKCYAK